MMGERRKRKPGKRPEYLSMLLPMSIRCNSCDKCMYKGTLFRSRKEEADICSLSGIQIQRFRFYLNCTGCSTEIAIKTYPLTVETGATHCPHMVETRSVPTDDDDDDEEDEPGIPNLIQLHPIPSPVTSLDHKFQTF